MKRELDAHLVIEALKFIESLLRQCGHLPEFSREAANANVVRKLADSLLAAAADPRKAQVRSSQAEDKKR